MINQTVLILLGLGIAAWGHLLVHDLLGSAGAWTRVDELFPPAFRSSPSLAGVVLLIIGATLVLIPATG